jgi:hypothetical protein
MGSGKTTAIRDALKSHRAEKRRIVVVTHRRSLGATLAAQFDLDWRKSSEAATLNDSSLSDHSHRDEHLAGLVLCTDSLSPRSGMRFDARAWRGAVVVIDEVSQVLQHTLMTNGTAVANRRSEVLRQLSELLRHASQVIVADAQLSEPVLHTLEIVRGCSALLIDSERKPAAGRELVVHDTKGSWRCELVKYWQRRKRTWVCTTSQKAI